MKLIKITPTTRLRVKEMTVNLLTEYNFVKVKKSGLVSLKRKWWSLKKDRVHITDLMISEIPKRIADIAVRKGKGVEYVRTFNNHVASILYMSTYSVYFDLVDYAWSKYVDICLDVPKISFEINEFELEEPGNYLALGLFNNDYWMGIIKTLRQQALPPVKSKVLKQVNQIKNKVL